MTTTNISKAQEKANVPFEVAKKIRQLLDEAKKAYGSGWDDADVEGKIMELVTED
ncbi:MAG: hypothetical protein ABIR65_01195 [Pseudolysinimonas sp.]